MAAMATKKNAPRDEMVMFRAKTEERDLMFEAAESLGMSFSTWARMTLLKEARKVKKQNG